MKSQYLAAAALLSLACVSSAAKADDVTQLRQEAKALRKQNQALEKRLGILEKRQAETPRPKGPDAAAAPGAFLADTSKGAMQALTHDGPLTWHGITLFGVLDAGLAWQSHGTPLNGIYPQGLEYAISKNSNRAGFNVAPGGMGYSGIGLKGEEELLPGLAGVFAVNTQFDLASGQLSNGPGSLVQNNGLPLASQSSNGDSARAGQAFNDYAFAGLSSRTFGVLTVGRQRTLTTDDRAVYDPIASSLAFSLLGYTGSLSSGDTENSRFDNSLKYRVDLGPARFGAIYKFADSGSGSPTNGPTYQLSAGADIGALSFDAVYSHVSGAITLSSLTAPQLLTFPANSLAGSVSDNQAVLLSAKYAYNQFIFFGGYEYINYADPKDPLAAPYTDSNGYVVSAITNNAYQYNDRILQLFWTGVKYAYDDHLILSAAYYHELQNSYGQYGCNTPAGVTVNKVNVPGSTCSGTEDAISGVAEYHFNKRFEVYGGLMYSGVTNGLASGFLYHTTFDPTVGVRYTF